MRQGGYPFSPESLGNLLANSDHNFQIAFFKGFCAQCKSWGVSRYEMQLLQVADQLEKDDRECLSCLSYEGKP